MTVVWVRSKSWKPYSNRCELLLHLNNKFCPQNPSPTANRSPLHGEAHWLLLFFHVSVKLLAERNHEFRSKHSSLSNLNNNNNKEKEKQPQKPRDQPRSSRGHSATESRRVFWKCVQVFAFCEQRLGRMYLFWFNCILREFHEIPSRVCVCVFAHTCEGPWARASVLTWIWGFAGIAPSTWELFYRVKDAWPCPSPRTMPKFLLLPTPRFNVRGRGFQL